MNREPAVIVATVTGLAAAVLTLLVVFGVDLSEDQQTAILAFVAVVAPIVAGFVTRAKVFAPESVDDLLVDQAAAINRGGPSI